MSMPLQHLIHWKGYDISEDTWEPAHNLQNASEAIADFHSRYPRKPGTLQLRGHNSTRGDNVRARTFPTLSDSFSYPFRPFAHLRCSFTTDPRFP